MSRKVLCVEDDALVSLGLADVLEHLGHVPVMASSFGPAMTLAKEGAFDLALLDVLIPGGNVMDIAKVLRARQIPLAFLTGDQDKLASLEGFPYLLKPYRIADLDATIRQLTGDPGSSTQP